MREKLPPAVRELCVSVTDVGRGGSAELGAAVSEITARRSAFDAGAARDRIAALTARRAVAVEQRAALVEQLRWLRESETVRHPEIAPGYGGTLAEIAARVVDRRADFMWLPGPVLTERPTMTRPEFQRLLWLQAMRTQARVGRLGQLLDVDVVSLLPPFEALRRMCDAARVDVPDGDTVMTTAALGRLSAVSDALADALAALDRQQPWCGSLTDRILDGSARHVWERASEVPRIIGRAVDGDRYIGHRDIRCEVEGPAAQAAYGALAEALSRGREWKSRLFKSDEQKAVESAGPVATVDGVPATSAESAHLVHVHLSVLQDVADAGRLLADIGVPVDGRGSRVARVGELSALRPSLQDVRAVVRIAADADAAWRELGGRGSPIGSRDEARSFVATVRRMHADVARRRAVEGLAEVEGALADAFAGGPSPESAALIEGVRRRDASAVASAVGAFGPARQERDDELAAGELERRLATGAPGLAALMRAETESAAVWDDRLARMDEAWAWRRAERWLADQRSPGRDAELAERVALAEREVAVVTEQVAGERAWAACLASMTADQVEALSAYRSQMAKIGKGTGRYVEINRAAAREAMAVAQGAVPAWVMPLSGVLSSVPATADAFDVVIVDEASQANILSLFLLMLAPRVIVVGDDKQCVPGTVGFGELQPIFDRLDDMLPDLPRYRRNAFTPQSSLFSLLKERFGQIVRLQEHFRCMPEIISWSSNEFYRDAPLEPLRQFGSDRLVPLRATYVQGAESAGRNERLHNRVEARAIVDAVERCIADPAYDDRTFGVVVLQGRAQVDVIRSELLTRIGPDEIESRRLRVGSPPDFQGDERDVTFLSMTVAENQRYMARTRADDERRFNVAASRGRDQMWLFHSVTADQLSPDDLRRRLLDHVTAAAPDADAMPTGVTRDRRVEPFDSLFEQRVFLDIVARGYHVNPQVKANGRLIDLVVTGAAGRLAVECDGDAFHSSPEQVRADLERERELQRAGWEFWRVRESEYHLDPVAALADLWRALDERGIRPAGADDERGGIEAPGTWLAVAATPNVVEAAAVDMPSVVDVPDAVADADEPVAAEVAPLTVVEPLTVVDEPVTVVDEPVTVADESATVVTEPSEDVRSAPGVDAPVTAAPRRGRPPKTEPTDADAISRGIRDLLAEASGPMSRNEIADGLGSDGADVGYVLQRLCRAGTVEAIGRTKGTRYRLAHASAVVEPAPPPPPPAPAQPGFTEPADAAARETDRRIYDLLAGASSPVRSALVSSMLDLDKAATDASLRRLRSSGRVEMVGRKRGAAYQVAGAPAEAQTPEVVELAATSDGSSSPTPDPRGGREQAPEVVEPAARAPGLRPNMLPRVISAMVRDRPVTVDGLRRRLSASEEDIRAALDDLVSDRNVTRIGNEYWRSDEVPGGRGDGVGLAPAARSTARQLLAVAAWGAPVTMERARTITRLPDGAIRGLLDELVADGVLRVEAGDEPSWARG